MIKIITDSTCDLPQKNIADHDIGVLPMNIIMDGKTYLDGIDITREEFYKRLPLCESHPTTSTPSIGQILNAFESAVAQGASRIIAIHISEKLSGTINTVRSAAAMFSKIPIDVIDSGQLSIGTGFQVLAAANASKAGASLDEILKSIEKSKKNGFVAAAVNGMDHLRQSGRVNKLVSGIGGLIKLNPILTMRDGNIRSELARTQIGAIRKLVALVSKELPTENLYILHTNADAGTVFEFSSLLTTVTGLSNIPEINITPVIGSHLGPGAIGFGSSHNK